LALVSEDASGLGGLMVPGAPCLDAPVRDPTGQNGWLLDHLGGEFVALGFEMLAPTPPGVRRLIAGEGGDLQDARGLLAARYDGAPGVAYLIRPDQHVAARFRDPSTEDMTRALARARGRSVA
jgi:3-(3-hydroxy-phenyl)propionate hydroxylase